MNPKSREFLLFLVIFAATIPVAELWIMEPVGSYQNLVVVPSGVAMISNSEIASAPDWPLTYESDTKNPSIDYLEGLYQLPTDLTEDNTSFACISNNGDPKVTEASDVPEVWALAANGDNTLSTNFAEELCDTTATNSWIVIVVYETSGATDAKMTETQELIISQMRNEYMSNEAYTPIFTVTNNGEEITITYEVAAPIQGMQAGFDVFAVVRHVAKNASGWEASSGPDFCAAPSAYSSVDTSHGTTFTISMTLSFQEFAAWGMEVINVTLDDGSPGEERTFQSRIELLDCENGVPNTINKTWHTAGTVNYDLNTSAVAEVSVSPLHNEIDVSDTTIQMESSLLWCDEDSTCANPTSDRPTYAVGQTVYAVLLIPDTSRDFEATAAFYFDLTTQRLTTGEIVLFNVSQTIGKIIMGARLLEVLGSGELTVEATANPLSSRLLSSRLLDIDDLDEDNSGFVDDVSEQQYARASRGFSIVAAEEEEESVEEEEEVTVDEEDETVEEEDKTVEEKEEEENEEEEEETDSENNNEQRGGAEFMASTVAVFGAVIAFII